jgi:hypothetical protein
MDSGSNDSVNNNSDGDCYSSAHELSDMDMVTEGVDQQCWSPIDDIQSIQLGAAVVIPNLNNISCTDDIDDEKLYPIIDVSHTQGTHRFAHHKQDSSYVLILDLFEQINAPLYTFDSLMSLLREESQAGRLDINAYHPTRKTLLKQYKKMFGAGVVKPQKVDVPLETDATLDGTYFRGDRDVASVFVFDAEQ